MSGLPGYLGRVLIDGRPMGTCFQIAPRVLVTAAHVVTGAHVVTAEHVAAGEQRVLIDGLDGHLAPAPAEVVGLDAAKDLAVLVCQESLRSSISGLADSDSIDLLTNMAISGVAHVDDGDHSYRWMETSGTWQGSTIRNESLVLSRLVASGVLPGMSGAPVRRLEDDAVTGVVSARYNSADGWLVNSVWVIRTEDLRGLLDRLRPVEEIENAWAVLSALSAGRPARARPDLVPLSGSPLIWNLPWHRNPFFVNRESELRSLQESLRFGSVVAVPQALRGIGGVGKTQLAIEYAYRNADRYQLVWWISAEQPAAIVLSLAEMAEKLGVGHRGSVEESARAALSCLRRGIPCSSWLVVVDNATEPSGLQGLLSTTNATGHLLVTSRDAGWAAMIRSVEVRELARAHSVALLRGHVDDLPGTDADLIAEAVGDLPLALDQAGTWLSITGMNAKRYTGILQRNVSDVLSKNLPHGYSVPVDATWRVSLQDLVENDESAAAFMEVCSFFAPEPIPVALFETTADVPGAEVCTSFLGNHPELARVIGKVNRMGLVRVSAGVVMMHRLVRSVVQEFVAAGLRPAYRGLVRQLLLRADPDTPNDPHAWPVYTRLLPHATATELLEEEPNAAFEQLILNLSWFLHVSGSYQNSIDLDNRVLSIWTARGDTEHLSVLRMRSNLAGTILALGRHAEALAIYAAIRDVTLRAFGADHTEYAHAVGNVAYVLREQGDLAGAETTFIESRSLYERILGPRDPYTILSSENLAATLLRMGRLDEAEPLLDAVRRDLGDVLGTDHPWTISADALQGQICRRRGDYAGARAIDESVLDRRRVVLGDDHPHTMLAVERLAESTRLAAPGQA